MIMVSEKNLTQFTQELCSKDADLMGIVEQFGTPPLWKREEHFHTLMHIILEQQVSLASGKAMFERISAHCAPEAEEIRAFGEENLRTIGVTRQKARYIVGVAEAMCTGELVLENLQKMSDDAVRKELTRFKGIGAWTADVYLLMALCRSDVFPSGDLALHIAAHRVKRLPKRPTPQELERIAEAWRPYRAVAARILWHWYLSAPKSRTNTD